MKQSKALAVGVGGVFLLMLVIGIVSSTSDWKAKKLAAQEQEEGMRMQRAAEDSARMAQRVADSLRVDSLIAKGRRGTASEWLAADSIIHAKQLQIPHDEGHVKAIDARLALIAKALRPGKAGYGKLEEADELLKHLEEPLSPAQTAKRDRLAKTGRAQVALREVARRLASIRQGASCKHPNMAKGRRAIKEYPGWQDGTISAIVCGYAQIGMNADQAVFAWGRPRDINRTISQYGVHEQWVYGEYGSSYLYFEDGVLTSIQN